MHPLPLLKDDNFLRFWGPWEGHPYNEAGKVRRSSRAASLPASGDDVIEFWPMRCKQKPAGGGKGWWRWGWVFGNAFADKRDKAWHWLCLPLFHVLLFLSVSVLCGMVAAVLQAGDSVVIIRAICQIFPMVLLGGALQNCLFLPLLKIALVMWPLLANELCVSIWARFTPFLGASLTDVSSPASATVAACGKLGPAHSRSLRNC